MYELPSCLPGLPSMDTVLGRMMSCTLLLPCRVTKPTIYRALQQQQHQHQHAHYFPGKLFSLIIYYEMFTLRLSSIHQSSIHLSQRKAKSKKKEEFVHLYKLKQQQLARDARIRDTVLYYSMIFNPVERCSRVSTVIIVEVQTVLFDKR